jgi:hypothetical protein
MTDHLGEWASVFADGELTDPGQRQAAQQHVDECASCQALVERITQTRNAVRSLPPVDPPPDFYERLLAAGLPGPRVRRGLRLGMANAAAAAVIWVLVLGVGNLSASRAVAPSVGASVSSHQAAMTTGIDGDGAPADSMALSSRWELPSTASAFRLASVTVESSLVRAEYSDGASLVTVTRQKGRLDWSHLPDGVSKTKVDGQRVVMAGDGQWSVMFVERAPYVYTVVAPTGSGVVDQMAAALPQSKSRSMSDRLEGAAKGLVDCFGLRG